MKNGGGKKEHKTCIYESTPTSEARLGVESPLNLYLAKIIPFYL